MSDHDSDNLPTQAASIVTVESDADTVRLLVGYARPGLTASARPIAAFALPIRAAEDLHADLGADLTNDAGRTQSEQREGRLRSRQRGWALVLAEALQDVLDGERVDAARDCLTAYRALFGADQAGRASGPLAAADDRGWEEELAVQLHAALTGVAAEDLDLERRLASAESRQRLRDYRSQASYALDDLA